MSFDEMRKIQLDILTAVDIFCKKNNLRYSLLAGTLLGAVRHKGFIPWDDDVDIAMPRPDYNKFVHSFNTKNSHLFCNCYETNKRWSLGFSKIYDRRTILREDAINHKISVNIDLFPIDGCYDDIDINNNKIIPITLVNRMLLAHRIKLSKISNRMHRILFFFFRLIPVKILQENLQKLMKTYKFEESKFVGNLTGKWGLREIVPAFVYQSYISIEFEGRQFSSVKDYDTLLKRMYGNYMEPPPLKERNLNHGFTAYWK